MVGFRKWIFALTVLMMFAGLASAQVNVVQCATNVSATPFLRGEGFTEETGDITLQCGGGVPVATGTTVQSITLTVFLPVAVTSRLLPISGVTNNASEALLMI